MNCRDCFNAKSQHGQCRCIEGFWDKSYPLLSVVHNRRPQFKTLPKTCKHYTTITPKVDTKSDYNRRKIAQILNAIRDGRKKWYYDEPPQVKNGYWEVWD